MVRKRQNVRRSLIVTTIFLPLVYRMTLTLFLLLDHHHVATAFTTTMTPPSSSSSTSPVTFLPRDTTTTVRPSFPVTTRTLRIRRQQRQLSAWDNSFTGGWHWDDIVYQTESLGNALASFSLQQSPSPSTDNMMMMMNTSPNNSMMNHHIDSSNNNNNMILALPVMYLAGLLTSFSPCVWGLLPLTISYISTAAQERSDQRTFLPTLAFATGLAAVFCTMGMITVLTVGTVFGSSATAANNPNAMAWTTTMILPVLSNLVCFIMGLKLLELIDIAFPSLAFLDPQRILSGGTSSSSTSLAVANGPILLDASGRQIAATTAASATATRDFSSDDDDGDDDVNQNEQRLQNNKDNNALFRTFLLGGSSALVASPCATPVLTSILAYVANTMAVTESTASSSTLVSTMVSTLTGGVLLFGYTLGYSTPLLIVAATSGQALVRLKQQQQHNPESELEDTQQQQPIVSFLYSVPNRIAPWVTPITGGILLYLGTTGLLVNLMGDPSLSGLTIIE